MVAARWRAALGRVERAPPSSPTPMTRSSCGEPRAPPRSCGWRRASSGATTPWVARRARAGSSSPTATGRARAGSDVRRPTSSCAGTSLSPPMVGTCRYGSCSPGGATSPTRPWRPWRRGYSGSTRPTRLAAMAAVADVEGRFATVAWGETSVRLLLAKNPAGWTELLDLLEGGTDPVVIGINARIADGHDPSWLWDVPFERLGGRLVVATGERCRDLAVRLRHGGVAHVTVPDDLDALRAAASPTVRVRRQLHRLPGPAAPSRPATRPDSRPRGVGPRRSARPRPGVPVPAPGMPVDVTVAGDAGQEPTSPSGPDVGPLGAARGGRAPGSARHLRRRRQRSGAGRPGRVARHPGGAHPRPVGRAPSRRGRRLLPRRWRGRPPGAVGRASARRRARRCRRRRGGGAWRCAPATR